MRNITFQRIFMFPVTDALSHSRDNLFHEASPEGFTIVVGERRIF